MSSPSEQGSDRPAAPEEKVCKLNEEMPSSAAAEAEADDSCCLSGDKPFWDVILKKSHVSNPYYLHVPSHMVSVLPRINVPLVLEHGGKKWNFSILAKGQQHRFEFPGWRTFVQDNNLEAGDACIFEVMESSPTIVRLRVVILRNTGHLPPELEAVIESRRNTIEASVIEID